MPCPPEDICVFIHNGSNRSMIDRASGKQLVQQKYRKLKDRRNPTCQLLPKSSQRKVKMGWEMQEREKRWWRIGVCKKCMSKWGVWKSRVPCKSVVGERSVCKGVMCKSGVCVWKSRVWKCCGRKSGVGGRCGTGVGVKVLCVLVLRGKWSSMSPRACHAKWRWMSASCHTKWRSMSPKCHACHIKSRSMSPRANACHTNSRGDNGAKRDPGAPLEPAQCHKCHTGHTKWRSMSANATPATQSEDRCHQVPRQMTLDVTQRQRRQTGSKRATRA